MFTHSYSRVCSEQYIEFECRERARRAQYLRLPVDDSEDAVAHVLRDLVQRVHVPCARHVVQRRLQRLHRHEKHIHTSRVEHTNATGTITAHCGLAAGFWARPVCPRLVL